MGQFNPSWLVVEPTPLKKNKFVSWDHEVPNSDGKIKVMFQENHQPASLAVGTVSLTLWKPHLTVERSTILNGETHYVDWAMFNSSFDITRGYCLGIGSSQALPSLRKGLVPNHPSLTLGGQNV